MTNNYGLGHSDAELDRLVWQAEFLRPYTERMLRMAGIAPGMRVLDVGCGAGDVTMLAARLVGPSGSVTGVDHSARPLALAASRAEDAGLGWIQFHEAELADYTAPAPFDAVVGRYVILHQADPVTFLLDARRHAAPDGVFAFHEMDVTWPVVTSPEVPLWHQADEWLRRAMSAIAPHADAASRLIEHFDFAGLPEPEIRCEVPAGGGQDSPLYKWMADVTRTLLPVLSTLGVATAAVEIDTYEDRLRADTVRARAQLALYPQFLAVAGNGAADAAVRSSASPR